jgi:hypothetical protein
MDDTGETPDVGVTGKYLCGLRQFQLFGPRQRSSYWTQ